MRRWLLALALLPMARTAAAQGADSVGIYRGIVAREPDNSRAVFRLAALQPRGSEQAIQLYERYTHLEPSDAWGYLALAEAQLAARDFDAALRNVERASQMIPTSEDVGSVRERIQRARRGSLPVMAPRTSYTSDTDGNRLLQLTLAGDIATGAQARFGVTATHSSTGDGFESFHADEARAHFRSKSTTSLFDVSGGAARVSGVTDEITPVGSLRLRLAGKGNDPVIEVRAMRAPLLVSPLLMVNHVLLSEARASLELPIAGRLRLRTNGQIGDIAALNIDTVTFTANGGGSRSGRVPTRSVVAATTSHNTRLGMGASLLARVGAASNVSAGYYQLGYDAAARAGYFAPRLVQTAEFASYAEIYAFDPLTISFDAGAGMQRSAAQGEDFGKWAPAFRLWSLVSVPAGNAVIVDLETDLYKSQLGSVTTSSSWASSAFALGVRWRVGH